MKKKKYFNPALRKVRLDQVQKATEAAAQKSLTPLEQVQAATEATLGWKKKLAFESDLSGHKCYHELHTPTVIRDIFAAMTPEEFEGWIKRLYPEP